MGLPPPEFRLVSWILQNLPKAECDLSSSGLPQPQLEKMGIDTSYDSFFSSKEDHEALLAEEVAGLYGIEAENVVATTGGSEAIYLAYSVFGKGRAVVPLPNYEPMFAVPKWLGMGVTSSLKRPVTDGAVYGVTDPNNPTGGRLGEEEVGLLADASKRSTVFVNEAYQGFAFERPSSLFSQHRRFVTCSTMTKFYGLGWLRVGWIIADRANARLIRNGRRLVTGHNSEYPLWLARQVLAKREPFVERARRIHSENLGLVREFAKSVKGAKVGLPEASPFCLVRYSRGEDSIAFARRLLKDQGVLVSPGDYFGAPRAFRLCFTAGRDVLAEGLKRLSDFLAS